MIDFVITWVDGKDKKWQKELLQYSSISGDKRIVRYRNWEFLKYWFRGVEENAPWVNKIYFVTEGHLPKWLNLSHPKLKIIKHSDIIDNKFLPVFNSRAIEVNIHKIKGLSDKFVYFNDDFFIIDKLDPSFFFRKNLPCGMAVFNAITGGGVSDAILEAVTIINKHFQKKEVLKNNFQKWFNLKYKCFLARTLLLLPWPNFTGFYEDHMPTPFLKSTFQEVWNLEEEILLKTSSSKFRCLGTVNPYIFKYWQFVSGKFYPFNSDKYVKMYQVTDDAIQDICDDIKKHKMKIIVLNDSDSILDFPFLRDNLKTAFDKILPEKSSFEK